MQKTDEQTRFTFNTDFDIYAAPEYAAWCRDNRQELPRAVRVAELWQRAEDCVGCIEAVVRDEVLMPLLDIVAEALGGSVSAAPEFHLPAGRTYGTAPNCAVDGALLSAGAVALAVEIKRIGAIRNLSDDRDVRVARLREIAEADRAAWRSHGDWKLRVGGNEWANILQLVGELDAGAGERVRPLCGVKTTFRKWAFVIMERGLRGGIRKNIVHVYSERVADSIDTFREALTELYNLTRWSLSKVRGSEHALTWRQAYLRPTRCLRAASTVLFEEESSEDDVGASEPSGGGDDRSGPPEAGPPEAGPHGAVNGADAHGGGGDGGGGGGSGGHGDGPHGDIVAAFGGMSMAAPSQGGFCVKPLLADENAAPAAIQRLAAINEAELCGRKRQWRDARLSELARARVFDVLQKSHTNVITCA